MEKYVLEEKEQEVFEESMRRTSRELGARLRTINARHEAMQRDILNNKL